MAKIATVVGARPQFIKAGAVSRALAAEPAIEEILVHTGQHFDDAMSAVFFRELELPEPRYNLGIASMGHGAMTGRMIEAIEDLLIQERPELLVVYGDTNSTVAGALAAAKLHVPVAHVEAGLRSFNRKMPEEINRIVTDHLATIQFCPTQASVANLAHEGITEQVHLTGDVMYDATLFAIRASAGRDVRGRLGLDDRPYALCTVHRAENTDEPEALRRVCDYLSAAARDLHLVVPLHPRTRNALERFGLTIDGAQCIAPLGYFDLHALIADAELIYTDSGGLQKEAYFHGKPCVTLRDETEWVETIEHGWNRLWHHETFAEPRTLITDYGTGDAANTVVATLKKFLA